ncbi:Wrap73, partial [Symbiodinium natans]
MSEPAHMYWLEMKMTAKSEEKCSRFLSKFTSVLELFHLGAMATASCQGAEMTIQSSPRPFPEGAEPVMQMFLAQVEHINYTESTLADISEVLADKDSPILAEVAKGFRAEFDVRVTKALQHAIIQKMESLIPARPESDCGQHEQPCVFQDGCCSTLSCVVPTLEGYDVEAWKDEQCRYNSSSCREYCLGPAGPEIVGLQNVQKLVKILVSLFKGASSDTRFAYDDAKRVELLRMVPVLNASYNDVVRMAKQHLFLVNASLTNAAMATQITPVAEAVQEAAECLDTIDSVTVKNLPGLKAALTFTGTHHFMLLDSLIKDTGVMGLFRTDAPAGESLAQTGSVDPMETLQDAVLKADEKVEEAVESIDSELPAPSKLAPVKASFSFGPSLDDFPTPNSVTYAIYHGDTAATGDGTGDWTVEVKLTAKDAELANSFVKRVTSTLGKVSMGHLVSATAAGKTVILESMPLPFPNKAMAAESIKMLMKHVGHINATALMNQDVHYLVEHPDEPLWNQIGHGFKFLLDASLTEAVEKILVDKAKQAATKSSECGALEASCDFEPGQCCSLEKCTSDPSQCSFNFTCAPVCASSKPDPRQFAKALAEKMVQMFAGASTDVRVAYDEDALQELDGVLGGSLPIFNMTFRSLQQMYAGMAYAIPPDVRGSPMALA